MLNTRANVEVYAKEKGYQPIQIDGIPEGFSWKQDGLTIGGVEHGKTYWLFHPNEEERTSANETEHLVTYYNSKKHGK